jgi:cytochrome P450
VAFGHGAHQCIGKVLVKLELQIVLGALLARPPGLRLAVDVSDLRFRADALVYGIYELPVTW